jgi:hypothetical protein
MSRNEEAARALLRARQLESENPAEAVEHYKKAFRLDPELDGYDGLITVDGKEVLHAACT